MHINSEVLSRLSLTGILAIIAGLYGCGDSQHEALRRGGIEIAKIDNYSCNTSLLTATTAGVKEKTALEITVGLPYAEVRKLIIKDGWAPIPAKDVPCDQAGRIEPPNSAKIYPELMYCLRLGNAAIGCQFEFVKMGALLTVETQGDNLAYQHHGYFSSADIASMSLQKESADAKKKNFDNAEEMRAAAAKGIQDGKKWREFQQSEAERLAEASRTPLERAIDPYIGTVSRYEEWEDEGGLNHPDYRLARAYKTFYGIRISSLSVRYKSREAKLSNLEAITLDSSPRQVREALSKACRIPLEAFKDDGSGDISAEAEGGKLTCVYGQTGTGGIRLMILREN
jgi:hypothetical protein